VRCALAFLVAVAFALASMPFASERALAITRDQLLISCAAAASVTVRSSSSSLEIPASGLPCWYYMTAVQNMSAVVNQRGERVLGICPPPSSTLADYVQAFVRYESQNKKTRDEDNPAPDVLTSLAKEYSCAG